MNHTAIDLHDFLDMELVDRLITLRNNGVRIGTVRTTFLRCDLYTLGSFYVEARTVRTAEGPHIQDALPFVKGPRLDKYLDAIDLSVLTEA